MTITSRLRKLAFDRSLLRPALVFLGLTALLLVLLETPNPFTTGPLTSYAAWLAELVAAIVRRLGITVEVWNTVISSSRFAVNIVYGCTGVLPTSILAGAILSYPGSHWRAKLAGIGLGALVLQVVNVLRLVTIFAFSHFYPQWFQVAHRGIWEPLIIATALLLWRLWARLWAEPARKMVTAHG